MRIIWMLWLVMVGVPAAAWETPARGGDLRRDLMDALRPHAEELFGAPVVFVVEELRVSDNVGFGALRPARPGGRAIGFEDLRPRHRANWEPDYWGGEQIQVLYRKSGRMWVAVHHATGATDVWWADPALCPIWAAVIPEFC